MTGLSMPRPTSARGCRRGLLQRKDQQRSDQLSRRLSKRSQNGVALAVLAPLFVAALAGCGESSDQSQVEREVQDYLQSVVAPAAITDIDCPDDAPIRPGSTFLCDGLVEGSFYEAQVTIIDEQGRREIRPRQAVMQVNATETALGAEAATALGFSVQANCGDDQYLVVSVGNTFLCKLERSDSAAKQDIEVEVLNEIGAIEWRLKQ